MRLLTAVLVGLLATQDVLARPSPDPKSPWVRHKSGRGKRHLTAALSKSAGIQRRDVNETASCSEAAATTIKAPKTNVWGSLTNDEAASVVAWLFAQEDLNLTISDDATAWDNSVLLVESMVPNKTDALGYIDGCKAPPKKYAHVVLNERASEFPTYTDILVGPLPIDNATTSWEPLTYPYNKENGGGKVRNIDADSDDTLYTEWLYVIGASVADITLELWNGTATGADNDTLDIWGIDPLWQDDDRIIRWDAFWNLPTDDFDAETLLPLGLYVMSDVTGRDPSKWSLEGWLYNSIFYNSTEAFREAFSSPGYLKNGPNVEGDWARTDQQGEILPKDDSYPPTTIAPSGSRFSVDPDQKYVEWMDWSFYIAFNRDTGMSLFDIRYKGKRLIYELGLQEALAHYAGNDPMQSGTSYLDTYYGFGPYAFELVSGYDCPAYATYLNTSFYVSETVHTHIDSICLFEFTGDYPMQRHSTGKYVSVTKNTYFVVRSVSTVGNYDYMFSYTFYIDGSIAVEVRASGYIQSTYFAKNEDYGFHINDFLSGSMHDHVLNWKVDWDILGTNNSVELMSLVPAAVEYPWSKGKKRNTMKLERSFVESEDESRFDWAANGATQVLVVNEDEKNEFGEMRGYRVLPYTGTVHLTVKNSSNLANAANWAGHDIQITKQKDTEPRAAHPYNSQDVNDPPVDFDKFFDGENLRKEDLVMWVNLGMHHVPHTGDLPNTVFTTAHTGIQFMPNNYFSMDQSRQTVNMVRIDYDNGTTSLVDTFGQKNSDGSCALEFEPAEPDLYGYTGDVVIRKFPYDPNNPYYDTESIV
ncbi:copper amine oxidase [Coniochaeta sp. 2T2.1]|nr:copper amine oxidase [Coniochaeta sp. 2T2.1]